VKATILLGISRVSKSGADIVLMDLQYAPALLDQQQDQPTPGTRQMLDIIARIAADYRVALFRRFEIMRHWRLVGGIAFEQMISNADGHWLHQNDWSYNCIAAALCDGLAAATGGQG
jgi:acyl-CoA thioesterase-1